MFIFPSCLNHLFLLYSNRRMDLIKSVPGWWRDMPPLEYGFTIFKLAREIGFDCRILTKGPRTKPNAWAEKLECIVRQISL